MLNHSIGDQLLNWHHKKHDFNGSNEPFEQASITALDKLVSDLLVPLQVQFGECTITYGFTSAKLHTFIQKHSPKGTAPKLDQHASYELNRLGNRICTRGGAACDITFINHQVSALALTNFIIRHLEFDKIYFYGKDRPLHVSVHEQPLKHLQVVKTGANGHRIPAQKAFGNNTIQLLESLYEC